MGILKGIQIVLTRFLMITGIVTAGFVSGFPALSNKAHAACDDTAGPGVNWAECRKRNLIMSGTDFEGSNMSKADLSATDLRETNFNNADFSKTTLFRASLAGSTAIGADFSKAIAFRTNFTSTDLTDANFSKSEVYRADFSGANLQNADFSKSELARVKFSDANLSGTNLAYSNLSRADLREAKSTSNLPLTGAFLFQTRLEGVDLSQATGLADWQLEMACGDSSTKLPPNITPPSTWPCQSE